MPSTEVQSSRPAAESSVDFRGRVRIEECYAIIYCDHDEKVTAGTARWKEGQLTYHKTERKVYLFGPKNKRLEEIFNFTLHPPPPEEGEEAQQDSSKKDLQTLIERPTLAVGQTVFLRKKRYEVRVERVKFVHHKPYKVASRSDREGDMIRDRVRKLLNDAPDILAGVLPPPKRTAQERNRSASPPPRRKH